MAKPLLTFPRLILLPGSIVSQRSLRSSPRPTVIIYHQPWAHDRPGTLGTNQQRQEIHIESTAEALLHQYPRQPNHAVKPSARAEDRETGRCGGHLTICRKSGIVATPRAQSRGVCEEMRGPSAAPNGTDSMRAQCRREDKQVGWPASSCRTIRIIGSPRLGMWSSTAILSSSELCRTVVTGPCRSSCAAATPPLPQNRSGVDVGPASDGAPTRSGACPRGTWPWTGWESGRSCLGPDSDPGPRADKALKITRCGWWMHPNSPVQLPHSPSKARKQ